MENFDFSDPYQYTKDNYFTSESYKIEIKNVPKYFSYVEFKKFLIKHGCCPHKITHKRSKSHHAFVTFKNVKDRNDAIKKINGIEWKNQKLIAKESCPSADPFIKKRLQNDVPVQNIDINDVVTPLWKVPYPDQLKLKDANLKKVLNKHFNFKIEILNIVPSPVIEHYRNKCEFTIGYAEENCTSSLNSKPENLDGNVTGSGVKTDQNIENTDDAIKLLPRPLITIGFRLSQYRNGSSLVSPIDSCLHVNDTMKGLVKIFEAHLRTSGVPAYDPVSRTGLWKMLTLKTASDSASKIMKSNMNDLAEITVGYSKKIQADGLASMAILTVNGRYFESRTLLPDETQTKVDSTDHEQTNHIKSIEDLQNYLNNFYDNHADRLISSTFKLNSFYLKVVDTECKENNLVVLANTASCLTENSIVTTCHQVPLKFVISPDSFFQINTPCYHVLLDAMVSVIKNSMAQDNTKPEKLIILDLCCGTGTIGQYLLKELNVNGKNIHEVLGIDINTLSIQDAKENARINGLITNVKYVTGPVETLLSNEICSLPSKTSHYSIGYVDNNNNIDKNNCCDTESLNNDSNESLPNTRHIAILDPPRGGLHRKVVDTLRKTDKIRELFYISCDISAGSRDKPGNDGMLRGALKNLDDLTRPSSKRLPGHPFKMRSAQAFDMFPLTGKFETMIYMTL